MPDYSEVEAFRKHQQTTNHPAPNQEEWAAHLRGSQMISMRLEDLLKGDDWATYLAHIQSLVEDDKNQINTLKDKLLEATCVGDEVDKVRMAIQYFRGRILAREEDINLPQTIIDRNTEMQEKQKVLDTDGTS